MGDKNKDRRDRVTLRQQWLRLEARNMHQGLRLLRAVVPLYDVYFYSRLSFRNLFLQETFSWVHVLASSFRESPRFFGSALSLAIRAKLQEPIDTLAPDLETTPC